MKNINYSITQTIIFAMASILSWNGLMPFGLSKPMNVSTSSMSKPGARLMAAVRLEGIKCFVTSVLLSSSALEL